MGGHCEDLGTPCGEIHAALRFLHCRNQSFLLILPLLYWDSSLTKDRHRISSTDVLKNRRMPEICNFPPATAGGAGTEQVLIYIYAIKLISIGKSKDLISISMCS